MQNLRVVGGNEAHPAHVGGEAVDLVDAAGGLQAVIPAAQIQQFKFIRVGGAVFGIFDVHAAHPAAFFPQEGNQMMADESTCTCYKNTSLSHIIFSSGNTLSNPDLGYLTKWEVLQQVLQKQVQIRDGLPD